MPVEVVAPMACETPPALGPGRAAELGEQVVRPQRDQLRQVARPQIGCGGRRGHGAEDGLGGCALACPPCPGCSFCCNLLASCIRGLSAPWAEDWPWGQAGGGPTAFLCFAQLGSRIGIRPIAGMGRKAMLQRLADGWPTISPTATRVRLIPKTARGSPRR